MARRRLARLWLPSLVVAALIGLVFYGDQAASGAQPSAAAGSRVAKSGVIKPTLAKDFKPGKALSPAAYQAISDRLHSMREQMAAKTVPVTSPGALRPATAAQTGPGAETQFHGAPGSLIVGKNNFNNRANSNTCGTGSTLAEPAAANEGRNVYYTGNLRHQEFSTDGGSTWTCAAAYPAGPAEAPIAFGDTDVIYDAARGVTLHSVLYVNSTVTNAVIRLFVRRNINLADNCSYTIDTDPNAQNVIDDYPHLGLSNDFVYVNANRVQKPSNTWLGAFMERLNLDQVVDCVTANTNFINFTNAGGQRILVPGQGARDVMYFAWVNTTSQWRVFSWADNSGTIFSNFLNVGTMTFGDPDCRGGTNNADWATGSAFGIVGFTVRTTVGNDFVTVWAATAADSAHPQAHVHGAVFRIGASQTSLTLVQQPVVWNATNCFGFPAPNVNDRGDIGMALAFGSQAGGGGSAVSSAVIMKDEFSPGPGGFSFAQIATGTHNPTRWGDYLTVRRNAPCGEWFDSTGYALSGGTALSNVNARYAEFGRGRDAQCYLAWRNAVPTS
jgi:hypothetical protein